MRKLMMGVAASAALSVLLCGCGQKEAPKTTGQTLAPGKGGAVGAGVPAPMKPPGVGNPQFGTKTSGGR